MEPCASQSALSLALNTFESVDAVKEPTHQRNVRRVDSMTQVQESVSLDPPQSGSHCRFLNVHSQCGA